MNGSCLYTFTLCRKCKKLRNCLNVSKYSEYSYLCKECSKENEMVGQCVSCGREGIQKHLNRHGGYCHICEGENIHECELCGSEVYSNKFNDGICYKCESGKNKPCNSCGSYKDIKDLSSDGLCDKCSIRIHKKLKDSKVNEVVECVDCGREVYVNDLNSEGMCIYCYSKELEKQVKKLKRRKAYS